MRLNAMNLASQICRCTNASDNTNRAALVLQDPVLLDMQLKTCVDLRLCRKVSIESLWLKTIMAEDIKDALTSHISCVL